MNRYGFVGRIKVDHIAEYKRRHAAVWPELVAAIGEAGIRNYTLFLRPDGLLTGYFEAEDKDRSLERVRATDVSRRWQAEMEPFFHVEPGQTPDQSFQYLEEVFHLE